MFVFLDDVVNNVSCRFWFTCSLTPIQVGNAVPPPMAKAIGLEIKKCVEEKAKSETDPC